MNIIETNFQYGSMTTRSKTTRIILHHAAASTCSAEDIHRWHKANGWAGAGYHFLVRKDGLIYRLRPEDKVGAHANGSNSDSIGICAEGNYQIETMPQAQKESLKELVSYIKGKYGISKVQKHSDVNNTSCPGANYPFGEIANGTPIPTPTPTDKITEDGKWGKATTRKAQQVFGTPIDGFVSNQYQKYQSQNPGLLSSTFMWVSNPKGGSNLIAAIQRKIGVNPDGFIGPNTIRAMQNWLGTPADGKVSNPSTMVRAFQRWLNQQ